MKLKFVSMLALSALLLSAGTCAQPNGNTGVVTPTNVIAPNENPLINQDPALKAQHEECARKGGQFGVGAFEGIYQCTLPAPNAGKACKSSADCSGGGFCLADTMTCAPTTPYTGCFKEALGGGKTATLCVD